MESQGKPLTTDFRPDSASILPNHDARVRAKPNLPDIVWRVPAKSLY